MSVRRVVVTGTSVVTPLGLDVETVWQRICAGDSGIAPIRRFDSRDFKVNFAGEVLPFDPVACIDMDARELRRIDRFAQFALLATQDALQHAELIPDHHPLHRFGCLIGSGIGGLDEIESQHCRLFDRGPERISPFMIPKLIINAASGNISVHWGLRGPNISVATACASGTNAVGEAADLIRLGRADVVIAGGTEAGVTPMGIAGFARMQALSTRNDAPELASRPFDADRDGFVLAEGCGILILEELEFARRRGAPILGEVLGYGLSADAQSMTAPDPEGRGAAAAMRAALDDAALDPQEIDYVNAHGTSTPLGDVAETRAIRSVYGSHADVLSVSSLKGHLGHTLGASGGIELALCLAALAKQVVPPTANLEHPGPGCDLDYTPCEPRPRPLRYIMKNSFAFGGHNASVIVGQFRDRW